MMRCKINNRCRIALVALGLLVLAGCKSMDGGWEIDSPFIDIEYTPKEP